MEFVFVGVRFVIWGYVIRRLEQGGLYKRVARDALKPTTSSPNTHDVRTHTLTVRRIGRYSFHNDPKVRRTEAIQSFFPKILVQASIVGNSRLKTGIMSKQEGFGTEVSKFRIWDWGVSQFQAVLLRLRLFRGWEVRRNSTRS